MRRAVGGVVVALLMSVIAVAAEDKKQSVAPGLKHGDPLGAFYVTKCAGAESDQVPIGENLCYRCKNGARPQVIVFTRSIDPVVVKFARLLDSAVAQHEDQQLRAFVAVLADSKEAAEEKAKKLAAEANVTRIPFVAPNDLPNGPENYSLNPAAEITVVVGNENKVVGTYAVASAEEFKPARVKRLVAKALGLDTSKSK